MSRAPLHRPRAPWLVIPLLSLSLGACGPVVDGDPEPDPEPASSFTTEAPDEGSRLWIEGALSEDGSQLDVEVWAASLGPVIGLAGQLAWDPGLLTLRSEGELVAGPLEGGHALLKTSEGRVAFGLAHGAREGDVAFDEAAPVLRLAFDVVTTGESRLTLHRMAARRADASWVPLAVGEATLLSR